MSTKPTSLSGVKLLATSPIDPRPAIVQQNAAFDNLVRRRREGADFYISVENTHASADKTIYLFDNFLMNYGSQALPSDVTVGTNFQGGLDSLYAVLAAGQAIKIGGSFVTVNDEKVFTRDITIHDADFDKSVPTKLSSKLRKSADSDVINDKKRAWSDFFSLDGYFGMKLVLKAGDKIEIDFNVIGVTRAR